MASWIVTQSDLVPGAVLPTMHGRPTGTQGQGPAADKLPTTKKPFSDCSIPQLGFTGFAADQWGILAGSTAATELMDRSMPATSNAIGSPG